MSPSADSASPTSGFSTRIRSQVSLLVAAAALNGLYYAQLLRAFIRNLHPATRPASLLDALRAVRTTLQVKDYTAVLPLRLGNLHRLAREIDRSSIPGDVVECGVYNGGSAALMASVCVRSPLERTIWLFDSFEGLPPPTEKDGAQARTCGWWCHGDLSKVRAVFSRMRIPKSRFRIVKGWFHDTFPSAEVGDIALLHIDADWYDSVRLCLERFYDSVQPGGYVDVDDYGHWEGCRRATDEFLRERGITAALTRVDYTGRYFQKPR
jgi:O-methyltransferase